MKPRLKTFGIWYTQAVADNAGIYTGWFETAPPQIEYSHQEMKVSTAVFIAKARNEINFMMENSQQVTTEAMQSLTDNLTMASSASLELIEQQQDKTGEIVVLLLEEPL